MKLEPIDYIPPGLELSAWSKLEFDMTTPQLRRILEQQSSVWKSIGVDGQTMAVVGVHRPPATVPELWVLITREFRANLKSNLPILKSHAEIIIAQFPKVIVRVDAECPLGRKFTEYMGFSLRRTAPSRNGREYMVFEVAK